MGFLLSGGHFGKGKALNRGIPPEIERRIQGVPLRIKVSRRV